MIICMKIVWIKICFVSLTKRSNEKIFLKKFLWKVNHYKMIKWCLNRFNLTNWYCWEPIRTGHPCFRSFHSMEFRSTSTSADPSAWDSFPATVIAQLWRQTWTAMYSFLQIHIYQVNYSPSFKGALPNPVYACIIEGLALFKNAEMR